MKAALAHPRAAPGPATIWRGAEVPLAQPERPRPATKTTDAALEPGTPLALGRTAGRAGLERQARPQRIPAPLGPASGPGFFPSPGWVFYSAVWLGEDGDALSAQGAGCGHKSPYGPSFPLLTRVGSRPASRPGPCRAP